jgi:hypothetical protein
VFNSFKIIFLSGSFKVDTFLLLSESDGFIQAYFSPMVSYNNITVQDNTSTIIQPLSLIRSWILNSTATDIPYTDLSGNRLSNGFIYKQSIGFTASNLSRKFSSSSQANK